MNKKELFSLIVIFAIISISIVVGVFYYQLTNDTSYTKEEQKFQQQLIYSSEEECQSANNGKFCMCEILNCDVPVGKTVEEACGKDVEKNCRLQPSGYFGDTNNQRPKWIAIVVFIVALITTFFFRKNLSYIKMLMVSTGSLGIAFQLKSWLSASLMCGRAVSSPKFLLSPGQLFNVGGANCHENSGIFSAVILFVLSFIIFSLLGLFISWIYRKIKPEKVG